MFDPLLIAAAVIVFVLLVIINSGLVHHFAHPDDKGTALWSKLMVQLSFLLAEVAILLLPLDIANIRYNMLPMDYLWQIVFLTIVVFTSFLLPFSLFWYESLDEFGKSHLFKAICYVITTFIFLSLGLFILYSFFGVANIPISVLTSSLVDEGSPCETCTDCVEADDTFIELRVTFPVYVIACFTVLGWLLFVLFGSIGIAALPMDYFNSFRNRPKPIIFQQQAALKAQVADRAVRLAQIGEGLAREVEKSGGTLSRQENKLLNQFKQQVIVLEQDHKFLQMAQDKIQYSPLVYFGHFILGLLGLIVSLSWAVHIALYVIPVEVVHPFLNSLLLYFDYRFPLISIAIYGFFGFYLLLCVYKGTFKFGFRLFLIPVHVMEKGNTLMNSFIFNLILILLCVFPVIQFCITSFRDYARLTSVGSLFGVTFKYLLGFNYFWDFYLYVLIGLTLFSLSFLLIFPGKKNDDLLKDLEDRLPRSEM
ncbi:hypothetical protein RCL1_000560 [Eukaryota sp. TZLM3-RCL]